jgi:putative phosphoesterase
MIFAAIGSINGNKNALECALHAIADAGIQTLLHTGDAVVGGPDGNEVIALLEKFGVICVQGNLDRLVVRYSRKQDTLDRKVDEAILPALRETHERLSSQNLERLRDWRKTRTFLVEGLSGILCHGSPGNPREVITADTPVARLKRQREITRADIIVSGGTDDFFTRHVDGALFVAPGSLNVTPGFASYALISTEESPWDATQEQVPLSQ